MKSKSKFIIALVLFGVVTIGAIAGIIAVVASFNANVESNFKVSYTAQNVHATVSAGYVVMEGGTTQPQLLTYTPIKAGETEQIEFNANDETEDVEKSFDGLNLEIKKDERVYFKYTFTHTGDETNSMKFLNIALTKDFSQFENLSMQYGVVASNGSQVAWNQNINELTAIRGEDDVVELYIQINIKIKTKDAKLNGMLNWSLTGSDEYAYDNAYLIIGKDFNSLVKDLSPTRITFDYLDADTENIVASAIQTIPMFTDGSMRIYAYVVGTNIYVLSEYKIVVMHCEDMFRDLTSVTDITFNNLDTSNVTVMQYMFYNCESLTNVNLSALNTDNIQYIEYLFSNCKSLASIDLSSLNTSGVESMQAMFYGCEGLSTLDISNFNTNQVTSMNVMFRGCINLVTIYADESFDISNVTLSTNMFYNCTSLVGGNGTVYDSTKVDKIYARIDTAETPGYFTAKPAV